jgi:hypothetical protein
MMVSLHVTMLVQGMMQMMGDGGVHVKFWLGKVHVIFTTLFSSLRND